MSRGTPDPCLLTSASSTGLSPSMVLTFHSDFASLPLRSYRSLPRTPLLQFGLGSSAFARHYLRNHCCFLFLGVLRCFSSPRIPSFHYLIHEMIHTFLPYGGFPIRTSVLHRLFAPAHGFSQLVTSFFGSQCRGIPPALLVA